MMKVPLSKPFIPERSKKYVEEVLNTPFVSTGPFVKKFESAFRQKLGVKYASSVSSGTAGLHLIVKSMGWGDGDEVITTPYSFIATSNALIYENVFPKFCDIDPYTFNLSPEFVEKCIRRDYRYKKGKWINKATGKVLKGIMVVHIYGYPANMEAFMEISQKYELDIAEDAAESLYSMVKIGGNFKFTGTIGKVGIFAFYANKQITTGEGGMIVSNDGNIYEMIESLKNQGRDAKSGKWLIHERIGYNYRLSALQCALGLGQMEIIEEIFERRNKLYQNYVELLQDVEEVRPIRIADNVRVNWFVFVIVLNNKISREKLMKELANRGIETRAYFYPPLHLQPVYKRMFGYKEGSFPIAEELSKRVLALPFYTQMKMEEQAYVIEQLKEAILRSKTK